MSTVAIRQRTSETRTRTYEITSNVTPTAVAFTATNRQGDRVTWTTDGETSTIVGLTWNGDGTGTWTIAAGDLAVGTWRAEGYCRVRGVNVQFVELPVVIDDRDYADLDGLLDDPDALAPFVLVLSNGEALELSDTGSLITSGGVLP